MITAGTAQTATVDAMDRQILRALQVAPRVPFRRLGRVLGVSEQTVARRYRRLGREGVVRVIGVLNPRALGQSDWVVRVQCRPNGVTSLATALAQRDDVGWVAIGAGGSEIVCALRSRSEQVRDDLLLQRLPQTSPVLGITASVMLHQYIGGRSDDWTGLSDSLTAEQVRALGGEHEWSEVPLGSLDHRLDPDDEAMLEPLRHDGRAGYATLAAAAGISHGRAVRRLTALLAQRIVYLDVDLSATALGFPVQANLWLSVVPSELDRAGRALSREPEVAFAAAISGPHNLTASVSCRDLDALYRFVTERIGAVAGVSSLEVSPVLRRVKQAGALSVDGRLADPAPGPRESGRRAVSARRAGR